MRSERQFARGHLAGGRIPERLRDVGDKERLVGWVVFTELAANRASGVLRNAPEHARWVDNPEVAHAPGTVIRRLGADVVFRHQLSLFYMSPPCLHVGDE
jgi:hypothetical protein